MIQFYLPILGCQACSASFLLLNLKVGTHSDGTYSYLEVWVK